MYSPKDIVVRIKENLSQPHDKLETTENPTLKETSVNSGLHHLSQLKRAKRILEENKINIDTKLHTFTVMGSTCPHVVTLFPKEICSCSSTTQCYHILAAKMAIGQRDESKAKKINLTQLRKNSRSKSHKKSGRKCPHPGDYDVSPAPDAKIKHTKPDNAGTHGICFLYN